MYDERPGSTKVIHPFGIVLQKCFYPRKHSPRCKVRDEAIHSYEGKVTRVHKMLSSELCTVYM